MGDTKKQGDQEDDHTITCGHTISCHVVSPHAGLFPEDLLQTEDTSQ